MGSEPTMTGSSMHVTPRQAQILDLVASGLSDKEIAEQLGVSPRTVQSHLDRLFLEHGRPQSQPGSAIERSLARREGFSDWQNHHR